MTAEFERGHFRQRGFGEPGMLGPQVMDHLRHGSRVNRLSAFGTQEVVTAPKWLIRILCDQHLSNEFTNFRVHRYFTEDFTFSCWRPTSRWSCSATACWVS